MRRRLAGSIRAGGDRVEAVEPGVQRRPCPARPSSSARTSGHCAGQVEAVEHRGEVEPGAGDEERPRAARGDVGDRVVVRRAELGDREVVAGIDEVEAVVADRRPLGRRRLGGADVHPPVHLHRVDGDDLGAGDRAGGGHRHVRLARRGRAEHDDRRPASHSAATGMRTLVARLGEQLDEAAR